MKYLLLPFTALILLFWNCSNQYFYLIDPEFKAYFDFPKGSYWIYYDEDHQLYDTVIVNYYESSFHTDQSDNSYNHYEYLIVKFKSSIDTLPTIADNLEGSSDWRSFSIPDSLSRTEMSISIKDFKKSDKIIETNIEHIVNGITYKHCFHYVNRNETDRYASGKSATLGIEYYVSKEIGVIEKKYEYSNITYHWKLIAYHIAMYN